MHKFQYLMLHIAYSTKVLEDLCVFEQANFDTL